MAENEPSPKALPRLEWTTKMDKCSGGETGWSMKGEQFLFFLFLPPHGVSSAGLLLGFALGGHGLHGLLHGFLIAKESHGLNGLEVCVQLVHNWDSCGQVQLHDGCVGHTCRDGQMEQISTQNREGMGT